MEMAPELEIRDKNQISALPLGSRVIVDPWSDRLRLLKAQTTALTSAKEKMPFQVTPFRLYLVRESGATAAPQTQPVRNPPAAAINTPTADQSPAPQQ
jgi:hypothetical protein